MMGRRNCTRSLHTGKRVRGVGRGGDRRGEVVCVGCEEGGGGARGGGRLLLAVMGKGAE